MKLIRSDRLVFIIIISLLWLSGKSYGNEGLLSAPESCKVQNKKVQQEKFLRRFQHTKHTKHTKHTNKNDYIGTASSIYDIRPKMYSLQLSISSELVLRGYLPPEEYKAMKEASGDDTTQKLISKYKSKYSEIIKKHNLGTKGLKWVMKKESAFPLQITNQMMGDVKKIMRFNENVKKNNVFPDNADMYMVGLEIEYAVSTGKMEILGHYPLLIQTGDGLLPKLEMDGSTESKTVVELVLPPIYNLSSIPQWVLSNAPFNIFWHITTLINGEINKHASQKSKTRIWVEPQRNSETNWRGMSGYFDAIHDSTMQKPLEEYLTLDGMDTGSVMSFDLNISTKDRNFYKMMNVLYPKIVEWDLTTEHNNNEWEKSYKLLLIMWLNEGAGKNKADSKVDKTLIKTHPLHLYQKLGDADRKIIRGMIQGLKSQLQLNGNGKEKLIFLEKGITAIDESKYDTSSKLLCIDLVDLAKSLKLSESYFPRPETDDYLGKALRNCLGNHRSDVLVTPLLYSSNNVRYPTITIEIRQIGNENMANTILKNLSTTLK